MSEHDDLEALAAYRNGAYSGRMKSATPNVVTHLIEMVDGQRARAEAAETERDALRAQLAAVRVAFARMRSVATPAWWGEWLSGRNIRCLFCGGSGYDAVTAHVGHKDCPAMALDAAINRPPTKDQSGGKSPSEADTFFTGAPRGLSDSEVRAVRLRSGKLAVLRLVLSATQAQDISVGRAMELLDDALGGES